jgi:hypothetical protein
MLIFNCLCISFSPTKYGVYYANINQFINVFMLMFKLKNVKESLSPTR